MAQTLDVVILALASYCQTATDPLPVRSEKLLVELDQQNGVQTLVSAPATGRS